VHCLDPLNLSTTKGNAPSALALFRSQALIQPGVIPLPALQDSPWRLGFNRGYTLCPPIRGGFDST